MHPAVCVCRTVRCIARGGRASHRSMHPSRRAWAETLKVRLQAEANSSQPPRYRTMLNALRLVSAEEGVMALWKGMAPSAARGEAHAHRGALEPSTQR